MAMQERLLADTWLSADSPAREKTERPFEFSLIRSEDNLRVVLLLLLLVTALTTPALVTNRLVAYTSLILAVFLTFWTRYEADWLGLRRRGQLGSGVVVVVIADFAWLWLLVWGTGGTDSPFRALLLVPILFSVALFSRLRVAVMLVTGLIVAAYVGFTFSRTVTADTTWQLTGMLLTIMALAWLAYAMCLVLERERRSNELVVRHMSEAVLLVDGTRRLVLANAQLERLTGVPTSEVVGTHLDDIARAPSWQNVATIVADVGSTPADTNSAVRELTIQGHEALDVRVSTIPCKGPTGEPVGWVVVCQDITAVKSLLRMEEKGRLVHEIRSPVTTLKVAASMLSALADRLSDDRSSRIAQVIEAETDRLLSTAGQLLYVSILEDPACSLNEEATDIRTFVNRVRRMTQVRALAKGISLHSQFTGSLSGIPVDPQRLTDALQQLCDNAIRHTQPGGEIRITAARHKGYVCISVSDTGPGIAADQRAIIFHKFAQLQDGSDTDMTERGLGLGLYIVRRVAELHGGHVEVESEPGRGSVFKLWLPAEPGAQKAVPGLRAAA